jgi:hypothetical protein
LRVSLVEVEDLSHDLFLGETIFQELRAFIYKTTVGVGVITDRANVKTPVWMAWSLALAYSRHMIRSAASRVAGIDVSALTSLEGGLCLFLMLVNLNVGQASSVKLIPASSFLN